MIRLDATTKILQLIATDTADVMVSGSTKTATTYTGFSTPTAATASTQTISAAPGAGEVKDHDHIELVNTGAANTVTFQTYNSSGAVTTKQFKAALATGDTVEYRHSEGWSVKDSTGAIKMTMPGYLPLTGGTVSGATTFSSTVATGALTVTGAATVSTTLGVTGASTLAAATLSGLLTANAGATVASGQTLTLTGATVAGTPTWSSAQAITLSTAAQTAITSVGTLTVPTSVTVNSGSYYATLVGSVDSNIISTLLFRGSPNGSGYEHAKIIGTRDSSAYTYGSQLNFYTEAKDAANGTDTSAIKMILGSTGALTLGSVAGTGTGSLTAGAISGTTGGFSGAITGTSQINTATTATDALKLVNTAAANSNYGFRIIAGRSAADYAMYVTDYSDSTVFFKIDGANTTTFGQTAINMVVSGTTLTVGVGADNGTVSAGVFTDRTKAFEGDAVGELRAVKAVDGHIDHATLPAFARANVRKSSTDADGKVTETVEVERDLGAMVSILTVAAQELDARLAKIEKP